jgi:hypothetical protein
MKEDTGTRTTPYRHQTPMHKTLVSAQATPIHIAKLRTFEARWRRAHGGMYCIKGKPRAGVAELSET